MCFYNFFGVFLTYSKIASKIFKLSLSHVLQENFSKFLFYNVLRNISKHLNHKKSLNFFEVYQNFSRNFRPNILINFLRSFLKISLTTLDNFSKILRIYFYFFQNSILISMTFTLFISTLIFQQKKSVFENFSHFFQKFPHISSQLIQNFQRIAKNFFDSLLVDCF